MSAPTLADAIRVSAKWPAQYGKALRLFDSVVHPGEPGTCDWAMEHLGELTARLAPRWDPEKTTLTTYVSRFRAALRRFRLELDGVTYKTEWRARGRVRSFATAAPTVPLGRYGCVPLPSGAQFQYWLPETMSKKDVARVIVHLLSLASDFDVEKTLAVLNALNAWASEPELREEVEP